MILLQRMVTVCSVVLVGKSYRRGKKEINEYATMSASERQTYVFNKMYQIVDYAINNIDFYREFYKQKSFNISMLKSFEDINKIPIITAIAIT